MNSTQIALRKKVFNVDSKYRTNGTNSNFNIRVNMPLRHNFNSVNPLIVEIPKTYYMFDDTTDNVFNVESPIGTSLGNIVLPSDYNFSFSGLATQLAILLNTAPFNTGLWSVVKNELKGHYRFTNDITTFKFTFTNKKLLSKYLGFDQQAYSSVLDAATGFQALESVNYVSLQRYDFFVIRSNIALNNNNNKFVTVYPNSYDTGSVIKFVSSDDYSYSVGMANNKSNDFNFVLEDGDTGELVNLHGNNWRLVFSCYEDVLPAVPIPQ